MMWSIEQTDVNFNIGDVVYGVVTGGCGAEVPWCHFGGIDQFYLGISLARSP